MQSRILLLSTRSLTLLLLSSLNYHVLNACEVNSVFNGNFIGVHCSDLDASISWTDANNVCQREFGTTLATILSTEDNQAASSAARAAGVLFYAWIGLNDRSEEGVFKWADNSAFDSTQFAAWRAENPDDYNGEDCVHFWVRENTWNDLNCTGRGAIVDGFVCNKAETLQPTTTPTLLPTESPTLEPSQQPSGEPSAEPSAGPSQKPSGEPSVFPSISPSETPTAYRVFGTLTTTSVNNGSFGQTTETFGMIAASATGASKLETAVKEDESLSLDTLILIICGGVVLCVMCCMCCCLVRVLCGMYKKKQQVVRQEIETTELAVTKSNAAAGVIKPGASIETDKSEILRLCRSNGSTPGRAGTPGASEMDRMRPGVYARPGMLPLQPQLRCSNLVTPGMTQVVGTQGTWETKDTEEIVLQVEGKGQETMSLEEGDRNEMDGTEFVMEGPEPTQTTGYHSDSD